MPQKPIKAVVFDLGDTLISYSPLDMPGLFKKAARSSYQFLKENEQPVGPYWLYALINWVSIRARYVYSHIIGRDFDSLAVMKTNGKKQGFSLTPQQYEHLSWLWYQPVGESSKIEPDIEQTFKKLHENQIKIGLLSNTFVHGTTLRKHLEQMKIWDYFDATVFSYEFPFRKPDPRIFEIAAERIKTPPQNILYVGDNIRADMKGALNAGMNAALKRAYTNKSKTPPDAAMAIEKITQIPALIEKHNNTLKDTA